MVVAARIIGSIVITVNTPVSVSSPVGSMGDLLIFFLSSLSPTYYLNHNSKLGDNSC